MEKNYKNFGTYLQSEINRLRKEGNFEMVMVFSELLDKYKKFEPEFEKEIEIDSWHGKSGIVKIIKLPDKITAIKFQKPAKGEKPQEVKYTATKSEYVGLIKTLIKTPKDKDGWMETPLLAENYCSIMKITHNKQGMPLFWSDGKFIWANFFSWRRMHNLFTVMLNVLAEEGFVEYVGGKTRILNNNLTADLLFR